jgi:hypothetical protein
LSAAKTDAGLSEGENLKTENLRRLFYSARAAEPNDNLIAELV